MAAYKNSWAQGWRAKALKEFPKSLIKALMKRQAFRGPCCPPLACFTPCVIMHTHISTFCFTNSNENLAIKALATSWQTPSMWQFLICHCSYTSLPSKLVKPTQI